MCPVPRGYTDDTEHFDIGFAVSDPYLAYALPIEPEFVSFELHVLRPSIDQKNQQHGSQKITWTNLPQTSEALMELIGYNDLGGVALALPMKTQKSDKSKQDFDGLHLYSVRDAIRMIVRNYQGDADTRPFNLLCYVQDRLTMDEAKVMAQNEPEIWEEVEFETLNVPSMNACVALNSFLYQHNGGGWPNTFG